jgi:4-amino-4-deoxy-L-arabinose transferase-like glycosyltransferase
MANFGMIEKGRLIEIEALYVSLCGLALVFWLSWWRRRRSAWLTWTIPWIFLGLGLLAKGPVHLLFFYAVVIAVLWHDGELRKLLSVAHLAGLLIMLGIFAAWAAPYWQVMREANLAQTWSVQLTGRLSADDFKLGSWLLNIPRGLAYFLPWTLLLPLVSKAKWGKASEQNLARALSWGAALPFLLVNLLPGALPRYAMPALVPACWLMAMTLAAEEVRGRGKFSQPRFRFRFVIGTAITASLLSCLYAVAVVPALQRRSKVKPIAAQIDRLIPDSESLYAVDPDYQPFLFYVRSRLVYVNRLDEVPTTARYVLVQPEREQEILESERWSPLRAQSIQRMTDYRKHTVILVKIGEG